MNHHDVLTFWFGNIQDGFSPQEKVQIWFKGGSKVDNQIKKQFSELHSKALAQDLNDWTLQPHPTLALIILLDQFSRNIYRKTADAYSGDSLALKYCKQAIQKNWDLQLAFIERIFLYMPLHHSENLNDQQLCLDLLQKLHLEVDEQHTSFIEQFLFYTREHLEVINRFGRFPHRNNVLQRESTLEEIAYLADGASSYGQ